MPPDSIICSTRRGPSTANPRREGTGQRRCGGVICAWLRSLPSGATTIPHGDAGDQAFAEQSGAVRAVAAQPKGPRGHSLDFDAYLVQEFEIGWSQIAGPRTVKVGAEWIRRVRGVPAGAPPNSVGTTARCLRSTGVSGGSGWEGQVHLLLGRGVRPGGGGLTAGQQWRSRRSPIPGRSPRRR